MAGPTCRERPELTDWAIDLGGLTLRGVADEDPLELPRGMFFPASDKALLARSARLDPLGANPARDVVLLRVQVFVIEVAGRTVLVDGGVGDGKERPARTSWHLRRTDFLARLGVAPEAVDMVLFTHLHADHVGWATRKREGRWLPTFPRARHLVAEREFAWWAAQNAAAPANHGSFDDSILPLAEAGLLDRVPSDHVPLPGIRLRPLPGHTPGQVGILLEGARGPALIAADAVHHPMQLLSPTLSSRFCSHPVDAVATRAALLAEAAEGLVLVPHHARGRRIWRVRREGAAYGLASD